MHGSVLHDGAVCAVWRLERARAGPAIMVVTHAPLATRAPRSVAAEGRRLMSTIAADAREREVQTVP